MYESLINMVTCSLFEAGNSRNLFYVGLVSCTMHMFSARGACQTRNSPAKTSKIIFETDCTLQGGGGSVNRHFCIRAAYICTSIYLQKIHWSNRHFATLTVEKQCYVLYAELRIRVRIRIGSALFLEAGSVFGSALEWKAGSRIRIKVKFRSFRGSQQSRQGP